MDDEPDAQDDADDLDDEESAICVVRIAITQPEMPHPNRVVRRAAELGLPLTFDSDDKTVFTYRLGGTAALTEAYDAFVSIIKETLPRAPIGPTSITDAEREAANWTLLVTAPALPGDPLEVDTTTARIAAAVIEASTCAIGVLFDHGTVIH